MLSLVFASSAGAREAFSASIPANVKLKFDCFQGTRVNATSSSSKRSAVMNVALSCSLTTPPYSYKCHLSIMTVSAGGVDFLAPGHPEHQPVPGALKPVCTPRPIATGRAAAHFILSPAH